MARRSKLAKRQTMMRPWTVGDMILLEVLLAVKCTTRDLEYYLDRSAHQVSTMRWALGLPAAYVYRGTKRRITEAERVTLLKLNATGLCLSVVAKQMGVASSIVLRWLGEMGLRRNLVVVGRERLFAERDARIIAHRRKGKSFRRIARIENCTVGAVAGACNRAGLCEPKKGKQDGKQEIQVWHTANGDDQARAAGAEAHRGQA